MGYLVFKEQPIKENQKTKRYLVLNKNNEYLGKICWSGAWRKYVFVTNEAQYDTGCLNEIVSFINDLMNERKK